MGINVSHLTDGMAGRWRVNTATSSYLVDLDARTAARFPGGVDGDGGYECVSLRRDGEQWALGTLIACEVGAPMEVMATGISDDPECYTYRRTTPVRSIVCES